MFPPLFRFFTKKQEKLGRFINLSDNKKTRCHKQQRKNPQTTNPKKQNDVVTNKNTTQKNTVQV